MKINAVWSLLMVMSLAKLCFCRKHLIGLFINERKHIQEWTRIICGCTVSVALEDVKHFFFGGGLHSDVHILVPLVSYFEVAAAALVPMPLSSSGYLSAYRSQ